ncbi:MAG: Fur family transcriptional regulator [Anaerolineae bacterium]
MSGHTKTIQSLKKVGYRLTPQRLMILSAIHESQGHISAEEIYKKVRQEYPYLDISTVYRTLDLLKELDLVTRTDLGSGCALYEMSREPHHHLVCRQCGQTYVLDPRFLEPLQATLLQEYGFAAHMEHLAIFGLCAQCRKQTSQTEGDHALRG